MTGVVIITFAAAAVLGAWLRVGLAATLNRPSFPTGTLVTNVLGSFVAGVASVRLDGSLATVATIGALGAFTTFSTFANEIADDVGGRRLGRACGYGAATVVGAIGAAVVGIALAR